MNNKRTIIYVIQLVLVLAFVVVIVSGGTFAYWQWASGTQKDVVFNTVDGYEEYVEYDPGEAHFVGDFQQSTYFCDSISTTVSVKKTTNDINFTMSINMDINHIGSSISSSSNVYWIVTRGDSSITCSAGVAGLSDSSVISYGSFNGKTAPSSFALTSPIEITKSIKYYTVWIWISNSNGLVSGETVDTHIWSQIDMLDKEENLNPGKENAVGDAYAIYSSDDNSLRFYRSETSLVGLETYNGMTVTEVYTGFEDSAVVPWQEIGNTSATTIVFEDYIYPISTASWFQNFVINELDVTKLDTSNVTDMGSMFRTAESNGFDLSTFDTSKVTDMSMMFTTFLVPGDFTGFGIENWDTSNVTDMVSMFEGFFAGNDQLIGDLSGWNVCKVTNYDNFNSNNVLDGEPYFGDASKCNGGAAGDLELGEAYAVYSVDDQSLRFYRSATPIEEGSQYRGKTATEVYTGFENSTTVPWSGIFNTVAGVVFEDYIYPISTANWFSDSAYGLYFDVAKLNTSNVTDMSGMFSNLTFSEIDVSNWDTSKVTDMSNMFENCLQLTVLDLSNWDTSNVTDMGMMFYGCGGLTSLNVSGFDTSKVTSMYGMFIGCYNLTSLNVSGFDTSKVTDMGSMFSGCGGLTVLDLSGFDTSKVTNMNNMFSGCSSLTTLDLSGFDTSSVTDMSLMFDSCSGLSTLNVSGWNTSKVTNMQSMFNVCSNLSTITGIKSWDTSSVGDMSNMFFGCNSLGGLDLSAWNVCNVQFYDGFETDASFSNTPYFGISSMCNGGRAG